MRTTWKPLTFLLSLTFLFLFSGSVFADDFQDATDAYERKDYKEAVKWTRLAAEQGSVEAQFNLGQMYYFSRGVPQDYVLAHMWWNLAGSNGMKGALGNKKILEEEMSKQQIEKEKQMARNWKPKTK